MAYQDGAEVLQPRVPSFDFPAAFVSPQGPTLLGFELLAIGPTQADQLHSSFGPAGSERITLVGFLSDQRLRLSIDNTLGESGFNKGDSRRRSTRIVASDLFTITKVPSMKHSESSSPPRARRAVASACLMCLTAPERTRCRHRRWHV
jgi:hypothetical protein